MIIFPQRPAREAAIALVCTLLIVLFIGLQFFAAPHTLDGLQTLATSQTSSPRATLQGFRHNSSRAAALLMEAYREHKAAPGLFRSESVKAKVAEADSLLALASRALDLTGVPPVDIEHRRLEATLLLKEVLDRVPLPDQGTIPGDAEVAAQPVPSWILPGIDIRIQRMTDGPRAGEYLFSGETVRQLEGFYRLVRNQPNAGGTAEDFYDFYSQSPGHLLPPKWYGVIGTLPSALRTEVHGQALWQWIGLAMAVALGLVCVLGVRQLVRGIEPVRREKSLAVNVVLPGAVAVAALFVRYIADNQINITGMVNDAVEEIAQGIAYLAMIWGILRFANALAEQLTLSMSEGIDAHLAKAAVRIMGLGVALTLLVYGASYLGIPLAGLLAGLGVGGLAVALAAKPTIENFIGGLILYADRPVRVGDLCRFGILEGRVEEIGLRSTRVRGLDRTLITIPNATFVNMNIINLTNRDRMPYERTIDLRSTESAAIRREIEVLMGIVSAHPKIEGGSVKVRLREGQEERAKAEICALILTSKWDDFLQIQQDIDLLLRDQVLAPEPQPDASSEAAGNVVPLKEA